MRETLNLLRCMSLDCNDVLIKNAHKRYKIVYKNKLKHAKIESTSRYIDEASNRTRAAWNIINMYRNDERHKQGQMSTLNELNAFFIDSVEKLVNSIPRSAITPCELLPFKAFPGFCFRTVTTNDIRQVIRGMRSSRSRDIYGLTTIPIKSSAEALLEPLKHVINSSIHTGIFPDALKAAAIIPIPKKGKDECRPISILPIISKIFERVLFLQMLEYFEENQILSDAQCGFRVGKGTQDAIALVLKELMNAIEEGEYAILSAYDLSKAFDCLNRQILLDKLQYYGFDRHSCDLIKSYFRNRTQVVRVDMEVSDPLPIEYGAAQGAILAPHFL